MIHHTTSHASENKNIHEELPQNIAVEKFRRSV